MAGWKGKILVNAQGTRLGEKFEKNGKHDSEFLYPV